MTPPSRENRPAPREPTPHTAAASPPLLAEQGLQPLLAVVAHELRTPLSALVAGSELLVDQLDTLDPDQLRVMVSGIHRGTLWMQGLVENLLCAASINTGRFQLHRGWVQPLAIVAEVQPVVMPLLTQKHQELRASSRGIIGPVWADRRRIGQVLVNLVSNARNFTPAGGAIDLTVHGQADAVRFTVADRGPGLPPGRPRRLFESFYRAPSAHHTDQGGLGLGLAIVQTIIEAHGGRVGAGKRPGGGARFWFTLPTHPPPLSEVRPPSVQGTTASPSGREDARREPGGGDY